MSSHIDCCRFIHIAYVALIMLSHASLTNLPHAFAVCVCIYRGNSSSSSSSTWTSSSTSSSSSKSSKSKSSKWSKSCKSWHSTSSSKSGKSCWTSSEGSRLRGLRYYDGGGEIEKMEEAEDVGQEERELWVFKLILTSCPLLFFRSSASAHILLQKIHESLTHQLYFCYLHIQF